MDNSLISVIIPCFNAEKYVAETLESVINQTYQNIEVIAIDDGSTDDTQKILHKYSEKMPNLKVISQKNTYYVIARQNAIAHAKGKYLVCLDSDDKLHPTYIEKCHQLAEKEHLDIVYADAQYFDANNKKWELPEFKLPDFLHCNCIYVTAMIRKSAFDEVGGFDTSLTQFEDWDLFISIIKHHKKRIKDGKVIGKVPETLFYYRQRPDSSSVTNTSNDKKSSDNVLKIYLKHYDFYVENGIYFHQMLFKDFLNVPANCSVSKN